MKESEKKPWKQKDSTCGLRYCSLYDNCNKIQVKGNGKKCINYKR